MLRTKVQNYLARYFRTGAKPIWQSGLSRSTYPFPQILLTWKTHGTPLGDRRVKETMHRTVSNILEEIEQWRETSSTDETLTSLTSIETFLEEINEMNHAILREEEDAALEFPSILKLLIKKIKIPATIL